MTLFQKLLGRPKQEPGEFAPGAADSPTLPLKQSERSGPEILSGWMFASAHSVGRQRDHNEDALFTFGGNLAYQDQIGFGGLFIVADGMGGHANGELASGLAVRTLSRELFEKGFAGGFVSESALRMEELEIILRQAVQDANQNVKKQVPGGGTTLTAVLIYQSRMLIAHVGDSRAYWISAGGEMKALTRDHSFVRQMVDLGQLTDEEAAVHPQRNILSMALGQWEPLEPEIINEPIPAAGHLLICSDGLWGVVPEKKIAEIILARSDLNLACRELINSANQAGGPDNITAILLCIP
jgi:protein phosphatase